jgi:hypothetical protein
MTNPERCASCDEPLTGRHCSACGESVIDDESLTLRGFMLSGLRHLFDLDRGLWRSLWLLIRRPGLLTTEYLAGRRVGYVRPLRLFILINILYFFIQPHLMSNTYNTSLRGHAQRQVYSQLVRPTIDRTIAERGVGFAEYAAVFDDMSSMLVRTLIIILVPLLAIASGLLFRGRGIPAIGHLVFSLHFLAFYLLVGSILLDVVLRLILVSIGRLTDASWQLGESILILMMLGLAVGYLAPAARRVFDVGRFRATVTAVALGLIFFPVVFFYRFTLFWLAWALV